MMSYSYIPQFSLLFWFVNFQTFIVRNTLGLCMEKKDAQLGISVHVHGCLCAHAYAYGMEIRKPQAEVLAFHFV